MGVAVTPYEELRRRKLEENRRKIEELKLTQITLSLREDAAAAAQPSPVKPRKKAAAAQPGTSPVAIRRSERKKNLVNYKDEERRKEGRRAGRRSVRRDLSDRVYASDEAREYAAEAAEDLQSKMRTGFPSFVKLMLQSHVTGGFWLGLPKYFCTENLPERDTAMTLVDEKGEESTALYLAQRNGLSGGWRGFAMDHELVDGDAVVFELVSRTTFKVYIIRQSGYYERGAGGVAGKGNKKRTRSVSLSS